MNILITKNINENNLDEAINLLNENKQIHGKLYSLNDTTLLYELYQLTDNNEGCISQLKTIIYEFNIKDLDYIDELKKFYTSDEWINVRDDLITYYQDNYEYEFLNLLLVNEKLYEKLYQNVVDNCTIETIEKYRHFYVEKHNDDILEIYRKYILNQAKTAKHKGAYTIIIKYLELMLTYNNSISITENLVQVLKNKYKNKNLLQELLDDVEVQLLSIK